MEIEPSSEVATAALIVNELDNTGAQVTQTQAAGNCANCGTAILGKHCHGCGQSTHIHRSLLHMVEELLHGLFHFDTKAWRTIPALILNPGRLTREYIEGKRTSYVSPLALFLFLIFLMFFVFSLTMNDPNSKAFNNHQTRVQITEDLHDARQKLARLNAEQTQIWKLNPTSYEKRAELAETNNEIRELQDKLDEIERRPVSEKKLTLKHNDAKQRLEELRMEQSALQNDEQLKTIILQQIHFTELELKSVEHKLSQLKESESVQKSVASASAENGEVGNVFEGNFTPNEELESIPYIGKTLAQANKNPELTFYKLKKNAANLAFLLMPISLPFLWLLFAFSRKFVMFDHAVFSLYSLSFMCLLLILIALLNTINFSGTAGFLFFFAPPMHMYRQLKAAYHLNFFATLWRTIALVFIALISLLLYAAAVTSVSL